MRIKLTIEVTKDDEQIFSKTEKITEAEARYILDNETFDKMVALLKVDRRKKRAGPKVESKVVIDFNPTGCIGKATVEFFR